MPGMSRLEPTNQARLLVSSFNLHFLQPKISRIIALDIVVNYRILYIYTRECIYLLNRGETMTEQALFTVQELADYLKIHADTIYRYIRLKTIPVMRVGGSWRFSVKEIEQWLASNKVK